MLRYYGRAASCFVLGLILRKFRPSSGAGQQRDGGKMQHAELPGRAIFRTADAMKQAGSYQSSGLLHPGCTYVAWKKKVECEDGIDPNAMLEVVHHRHTPPKQTADPATQARERAEGAIALANKRARSGATVNGTGRPRRRAAVLMSGLIARDEGRHLRCTPRGRMRQLQATKSQIEHLFAPLVSAGYSVHLFLSTSECVDNQVNFTDTMRKAYEPWLAGFHSSSCRSAPDHRCLIKNALGLLDRNRGFADLRSSDLILMTRPDLLVSANGGALVLDMVCLFFKSLRCLHIKTCLWSRIIPLLGLFVVCLGVNRNFTRDVDMAFYL